MVSKEEFQIIWHLDNGNVRVDMIAHYMGMTEKQVFDILRKLESEGYVNIVMTTSPEGTLEINYALPNEKARPLFEQHTDWQPEDRGF